MDFVPAMVPLTGVSSAIFYQHGGLELYVFGGSYYEDVVSRFL